MANKVELRARLDFWQAALKKLRTAYLALVDGGVKSYMIDDRQLTRFDLPALQKQIEEAEAKIAESKKKTSDSSAAIQKEKEAITQLLEFADGVASKEGEQ